MPGRKRITAHAVRPCISGVAMAEEGNRSAAATPSAPESHRRSAYCTLRCVDGGMISMEDLIFSQHPGTRTPQTPPVVEPFSRGDIDVPPKTPAGRVAERQFEPMTPEDRESFLENSPCDSQRAR